MRMLLRLRVSLPDRPGALGQVARAFGLMGADILQMTVLERQAGRAVDDFTVSWPGRAAPSELGERIGLLPGVRVEGVWPTRNVPGSSPDYDVLGHIAADPDRAVIILVDAMPDLLGADWAAALEPATGSVLHGSWQFPGRVPVAELTPMRPVAISEAGLHIASVPLNGAYLVVARSQGPAFHRAELDRITRLVGIVGLLAGWDLSRTA